MTIEQANKKLKGSGYSISQGEHYVRLEDANGTRFLANIEEALEHAEYFRDVEIHGDCSPSGEMDECFGL